LHAKPRRAGSRDEEFQLALQALRAEPHYATAVRELANAMPDLTVDVCFRPESLSTLTGRVLDLRGEVGGTAAGSESAAVIRRQPSLLDDLPAGSARAPTPK
jgi:hypothetical protein